MHPVKNVVLIMQSIMQSRESMTNSATTRLGGVVYFVVLRLFICLCPSGSLVQLTASWLARALPLHPIRSARTHDTKPITHHKNHGSGSAQKIQNLETVHQQRNEHERAMQHLRQRRHNERGQHGQPEPARSRQTSGGMDRLRPAAAGLRHVRQSGGGGIGGGHGIRGGGRETSRSRRRCR